MSQLNEIRLLKNIPSRTLQLSLIALIVSSGIAGYFYLLGLTMSSVMIGCFSVAVVFILLLQLLRVVKDVHTLVIAAVCALLIVSGFVEGSVTCQYLFFFPLVVVIPIVVDIRHSSLGEFIATFALVCISFTICFYVGHATHPIEYIPALVAKKMTYSNAIGSMATTLLFSIAYIVYEKRFIRALHAIAYIQSHEMRRPVASIIGLMDVWKKENYRYDPQIVSMIETTVTELDEKIHLIESHTAGGIYDPPRAEPPRQQSRPMYFH
ncbi:MAG TPA: hypothetical protein VHB54_06410 [Mucilaginibacter sp.]|nr:hypothetical protein [Mucilaginibacter sp.]